MLNQSQKPPVLCYLCGEPLKRRQNWSKDHIPPDNIFPSGTPQITVPCCIQCNGGFSEVDEIMRNRLAFSSEYSPEDVRDTALRSMQKAIAKFGHMNIFEANDDDGRKRIGIRFNDDIANRWLERIVRGGLAPIFQTGNFSVAGVVDWLMEASNAQGV